MSHLGETRNAYTIYIGTLKRQSPQYRIELFNAQKLPGWPNCITLWSGWSHGNTPMLDCFHYCGACSIQEPSECERDACCSVGWRLQASWRLCARRPDDAVQSRQTAVSYIPLALSLVGTVSAYYPRWVRVLGFQRLNFQLFHYQASNRSQAPEGWHMG